VVLCQRSRSEKDVRRVAFFLLLPIRGSGERNSGLTRMKTRI
jgi:hypothetical protein